MERKELFEWAPVVTKYIQNCKILCGWLEYMECVDEKRIFSVYYNEKLRLDQ